MKYLSRICVMLLILVHMPVIGKNIVSSSDLSGSRVFKAGTIIHGAPPRKEMSLNHLFIDGLCPSIERLVALSAGSVTSKQLETIDALSVQAHEELCLAMNELYDGMSALLFTKRASSEEYPLTRCANCKKKKKKKRIDASLIFSTLASSCVQFGSLAAIAGPDKQAALNLFGLLFNFAAQATAKSKDKQEAREHGLHHEEGVIAGLTEDEVAANLVLFTQAINNMIAAQKALTGKCTLLSSNGFGSEQLTQAQLRYPQAFVPDTPFELIELVQEVESNLAAILDEAVIKLKAIAAQ